MIKIILDTWEEETSQPDPEDASDRANTRLHLRHVSAIRTSEQSTVRKRGFYDEEYIFDVEPNENGIVYAVVARYSTGDTFGTDDGRVEVMDVFDNNEDAATLTEALEASGGGKDQAVVDFELKHGGREYYLPWVGYFEVLENVDVHPVRVS